MKSWRWVAVAAGLFVILQIQSTSAQTFIMQNRAEDRTKLGARFLHPSFDEDVDLSTFSGAYDFYLNVPLSPRVNFVGSVPLNAFSGEGDSESGIGDIYLGLQGHGGDANKGTNVSIGVFLPTASTEKFGAHLFGLITNFHELQRSAPDVLSVYGNFSYHNTQANGPMFGIEIGPMLSIPTGDNEGDTELFGHYGFAGGFQLTNVAIFAELLGLFIISEEADNFGDRFTHSINFGAQLTGNSVRPGLFYMIPLDDDLDEILNGAFGVKVDFILP